MLKAFDWKRSWIDELKAETVAEAVFLSPDWLDHCFMYEKIANKYEQGMFVIN
jgi:hypothetical protein